VARLSEFKRRMGPKEALKETVLSAKTAAKAPKKPFQGECFNCGKKGHMKAQCKSKKQGQGPSTGPLATPSRGRGLSPGPRESTADAKSAIEAS
jgi:hypothetical protein